MRRTAIGLLGASFLLSGCGLFDGWFGASEGPPLPGTRIAVLRQADQPAPEAAGVPAQLPPPISNADWSNPGGQVSHAGGNLALAIPFRQAWRSSAGSGTDYDAPVLTEPAVAGGVLYATDAVGRLTAFDAGSGRQIWRVRVANPDEDSLPIGGGVAVGPRLVYATTGFGEVLGLDPANGALVWRTKAGSPVRSGPTVAGPVVLATNIENVTTAFDAATGEVVWTHTAIPEIASVVGGSSPAVAEGVIVAGYTSGEVYALRPENGRPLWTESLAPFDRTASLSAISDIRGMPVIDRGFVFASSHSGRIAGFDLRSGGRLWEQPFGGIETPWVVGNMVFVVTNDARVVALVRETGAVKWITQLEAYEDPEDREDPIEWSGPVLANGRLILVSSSGGGVLIDPQTGDVAGRFDAPASRVTPIVAGQTLYIRAENGDVVAYR